MRVVRTSLKLGDAVVRCYAAWPNALKLGLIGFLVLLNIALFVVRRQLG